MAFWLFLLFTLFTDNTGFCDEISVFVKTGDLVQLDIQTKPPEFKFLFWTNYKSENIVTYTSKYKEVDPHSIYKNRVDFSETSFSLTLKNMQKNDSGLYRARTSGELEKTIVTYRVSVIDEVEDPVLTVNSSWSSPDPCSFTCKGSNISISYNFNGSSCSSQEVTSADDHTLRLSCSNDSIMCNYSNPVSFKTVVKKVHELCSDRKETKEPQASVSPAWIIVLIFLSCLLTLILVAVIIFHIFKGRKGAQEIEQTVYATPEENYRPQNPVEMLEKSVKAPTVYDTVKDSRQTGDIKYISPNDDPTNQSALLKGQSKENESLTIYSTIQKQPNPSNPGSDRTIYAEVNKPTARYESAHP